MKLLALLRKPPAPRCEFACEKEAVCRVRIEYPCGHGSSRALACMEHLQGIHKTGGRAEQPCECPECHNLDHAFIRHSEDIDPTMMRA